MSAVLAARSWRADMIWNKKSNKQDHKLYNTLGDMTLRREENEVIKKETSLSVCRYNLLVYLHNSIPALFLICDSKFKLVRVWPGDIAGAGE
jgi:hypothetical protein